MQSTTKRLLVDGDTKLFRVGNDLWVKATRIDCDTPSIQVVSRDKQKEFTWLNMGDTDCKALITALQKALTILPTSK